MIIYFSIINSIILACLTRDNEAKNTSKRLILILISLQIVLVGIYLWSYYNNRYISWIHDPFPWLIGT